MAKQKAWPKSADPTKGLGHILLGPHEPDENDRPLPFGKDDDDDRAS